MAEYKRIPTYLMFIAELIRTTVKLQGSDKDSFQPAIFLSPTGAETSRVLIAGTAVDKEDVGNDGSFQRLRISDPTGTMYVYAGQYQPEAAIAIKKLNTPCFVMATGKISHYVPEAGKDIIVSLRAEAVAAIDGNTRDMALVDIAHHTTKRLIAAQDNQKVKANYPGFDFKALARDIDKALDQVIIKPTFSAAPEAKTPVNEPAKVESKPAVKEPVKNTETAPKVQETQHTIPKPPEQPANLKPASTEGKNSSSELVKPDDLNDAEFLVFKVLKTSKNIEQGISIESLHSALLALGHGMLDVTAILEKLKSLGYVFEIKKGHIKAI